MFDRLSEKQRNIVDCEDNRIVVKACPGSGKTFSVTARLAKLIKNNSLDRHQGIATLSFTNTACEEIRKSIKDNFGIEDVSYPHYIGTLDSFINNYIFLPYGHLFMKCTSRPEIVGTEYNKWYNYDHTKTRSVKRKGHDIVVYRDPNYYFDKVSFSINNTLLRLMSYQSYHFGKADWEDPYLKGSKKLKKIISDLFEMKYAHFNEGRATQSDANYIALQVLAKYPSIAKNIANRFPTLIIDEAQDTTTIQMAIIDSLDNAGMKSMMLIGDPDQAIFEWNTADPSLFLHKCHSGNWTRLELFENRRSSDNICTVIKKFFNGNMESVAIDKHCTEKPILRGYDSNIKDSVIKIEAEFRAKCVEMGIDKERMAVVYRGGSFGEEYFNLSKNEDNSNSSMWILGNYYVRDITYGKFLIDNGMYKAGLHLIERGFLKQSEKINYISSLHIRSKIDEMGFREHRLGIFDFIKKLPQTNQTLQSWITEAYDSQGLSFQVNTAKSNVHISQIFHNNKSISVESKHLRTIHSVKGMSLEAILVFLKKKDGSNYSTILPKSYNTLNPQCQEQLRVVYVACSRPKKILWIAVPEDDIDIWNDRLQINT